MAGGDDQRRVTAVTETVAALRPWFHNLHLPDGTQTAPEHFLGDFPAYKWRELAAMLPADLDGWTVLDIGCNAGFYSLELARLGARVTAIDSDPHYLRQAHWAAARFGLAARIAFEHAHLYALLHDERTYDLVLFLGLFYHLRYPLLGLDIAARKARRLLALQCMLLPNDAAVDANAAPDGDHLGFADRERMQARDWPKMAFIEHRLANDPTNWWVPNHTGIEAMLRSCDLRVIGRPGLETWLCEPAAGAGVPAGDHDALRAAGRARAISGEAGDGRS